MTFYDIRLAISDRLSSTPIGSGTDNVHVIGYHNIYENGAILCVLGWGWAEALGGGVEVGYVQVLL